MPRETASVIQSYSGCHCTPTANPGAVATRTASIVPSGAVPSRDDPRRQLVMPWLCNELIGNVVAPATRCSQLPGVAVTVCALPVRTRLFGCIGVEWSIRPGRSCKRWCRDPPSATFNSCMPRQIASKGSPARMAARISGNVTLSRAISSGVPSACRRPVIETGMHIGSATSEDDAVDSGQNGRDIASIATGGQQHWDCIDDLCRGPNVSVGRRMVRHAERAEELGAAGNPNQRLHGDIMVSPDDVFEANRPLGALPAVVLEEVGVDEHE